MLKRILYAFAFVFACASVYAQQQLPSNFFYTKLANGLEVLVIEDRTVPLATIEVAVHNGSFAEDPEYNGLSHLYEHMFFKANQDIPNQEAFIARANELGIAWNGTTNTERVNYFFTLNKKNLKEGLLFMNSAIRYPLFLEEEMKKENPVVDGEFQRAESNPAFFLFNDLNRHMWGDLYSRKNVIGDHDIILTATTQKMKTIQERYYYPNNSILVVAGDVNHSEVFSMAESIYGDWKPSGFDIWERNPVPEFKPLTQSVYYITENANTQTPMIVVGLHGPDTRNDIEATYAADIFSTIMNQTSSKFQKELVDAGLATQVNVSYQTQKYVGPINIFMVPVPGKINEALAKLEEQIGLWGTDGYFTDEQLQTAKTLMAINEAYGKESTSNFIHTVTYWWASATIDYYTTYINKLNAVTRDDIKKYVNTYITGKPRITGLLLSPEMKQTMTLEKFSSN
jgi:zinc protease